MKSAILLVDHGSRLPEANALLEQIRERVQERVPDRMVHTAHMALVPPSISEGVDACVAGGANEIVVQPYFLVPGSHTTHDIPTMVREAAGHHPGLRVRIGEPLGLHTKLIEVILERVEAASG